MFSPEQIDYLKTIFVTHESCETRNDIQNKEIVELKMTMVGVHTKLNMLLGILGAIGVAVLGIVVKMMFT